jgi:phage-related protein
MVRKVRFYKTKSLKCPVEEFLDSLPGKVAQKITWILSLIEEIEMVPKKFFKKLNPHEIWEVRLEYDGNYYRILSFIHKGANVVLTHGFIKKTKRTPLNEIEKAMNYKNEYEANKGEKK